MTKTIKSPACKNGNADKLQNELTKMAVVFDRANPSYLGNYLKPNSAFVSSTASTLIYVLESDQHYAVADILEYTNELIKFMSTEYDVEIELNNDTPSFHVDVDSWYDTTSVSITLKMEFTIKKWSMFDDFLKCEEETRLLEEAKTKEAAKKKRAANKQAKIDKEIQERQLLADLKKKYPDA